MNPVNNTSSPVGPQLTSVGSARKAFNSDLRSIVSKSQKWMCCNQEREGRPEMLAGEVKGTRSGNFTERRADFSPDTVSGIEYRDVAVCNLFDDKSACLPAL